MAATRTTMVHVLALLVLATLGTSTSAYYLVIHNNLDNGKLVHLNCTGSTADTVPATSSVMVKMVPDDPTWTCRARLDRLGVTLYDQAVDKGKFRGDCFVKIKSMGFYRWDQRNGRWALLAPIHDLP